MIKNYFLSGALAIATFTGMAQSDRLNPASAESAASARASMSLLVSRPAQQPSTKSMVACDSIMVDTVADNGYQGNMFDINVLNTITLQTFSMAINTGVANVAIFYRTGTYVGHETSAAGWTFLDSATVNATTGIDSKVPVNLNLVLAPGLYSFYVTVTASAASNQYTNGTAVGTVHVSDANIQVKEGNGGAYPFNVVNSPRIFNGQVFYCVGATGISETATPSFSVYPNPADGNVSVDLSAFSGKTTLNLCNALGQVVLRNELSSGRIVNLATESYPAGVYLLQVTTETGSFTRKLIIK